LAKFTTEHLPGYFFEGLSGLASISLGNLIQSHTLKGQIQFTILVSSNVVLNDEADDSNILNQWRRAG
jgi:hypothetical protein